MLTLIAILTIAGASPSEPPPTATPCCTRSQTFSAATESVETGHRVGHVIAPAIMTTSFYGGALYFGADRKQARIASVALSLAVIIAKELYDHSTEARAFSTLDVALGVGGTAIGLVAAEKIEWPEETSRR